MLTQVQPSVSLQTQTCSRDPLTGYNLSRVQAPDPRHRVRQLLKNTRRKKIRSLSNFLNQTNFYLHHVKERLMCTCTDTHGGAGMVYACTGGKGRAEIATFDLTLETGVQNAEDIQQTLSG